MWLTHIATNADLQGIAVIQDERGLRGFVIEEGRTGSWNALLTQGRSNRGRRQPPKPGVALGVGFAVGGVGLGGLSAWQFDEYHRLQGDLAGTIPLYETRQQKELERDQALTGASIFLGSAIALGTASVVSLITEAAKDRRAKKRGMSDGN